mmetsp:Transcript_47142/g.117585  ORF Transcript_47142/g.117585 Transcript_47142/m.117585 type:complete len:99 (+) Transcript_47142:338-634(+)
MAGRVGREIESAKAERGMRGGFVVCVKERSAASYPSFYSKQQRDAERQQFCPTSFLVSCLAAFPLSSMPFLLSAPSPSLSVPSTHRPAAALAESPGTR